MLMAIGNISEKHKGILVAGCCTGVSYRDYCQGWSCDILEGIKYLEKYSDSDFISEPPRRRLFDYSEVFL